MPRRNVKNNILLDKQKMIASRLMEISLKLDDYIYKQIPILIGNAERYIREVNSYRKHCLQDERSLQVIGKLSRCMRGIIAEQFELEYAKSITTHTEVHSPLEAQIQLNSRTNTISPVYSLPDTDKTYCSECCERDNKEFKEASEVEIPIIDSCENNEFVQDETEFIASSHRLIYVEIDIQRAMSDLSLKTNEDIPVSNTECIEDCSQSIRSNYENHEKSTEFNNLKKVTNNDPIKDVLTVQYKNQLDEISTLKEAYMEHVSKSNKIIEAFESVRPNVCNDNTNSLRFNSFNANNNLAKVNEKIPRRKKEVCIKQKNINKKIIKRPKNPKNNQSKPKGKNKVKDSTKLNNAGKDKLNFYLKPTKNNVPQLKQCTENNLSWVEKIRYVREVNTSEYNTKLVICDESFWDNCTFPDDWNEQEFVYD